MKTIWIVGLFACSMSAAVAQQSARPSQGNAGAAPSTPASSGNQPKIATGVLDTEKYPFDAAAKLLASHGAGNNAGNRYSVYVPSVSTARKNASVASAHWQRPIMLQRDAVPLSGSQRAALNLGEDAASEPTVTTLGKDGRVLFTYGVGLPTIICAPLRVSTIELQPGEKITGQPEIGDSTRWEVYPASSGTGDMVMPVLVIKPHAVGLDTNLVVTTDKRVYYLRLVSKATEYIARTAFTYQEDENKMWQQFLQQQQARTESEQARSVVTPLAGDALDHLNFNYDISGGTPSIRPVRVMDDGVKTYITMPDAALHRELPALVVENPKIKGRKGQEIVNYRVKDNIYIVDRLFDRAALLLGVGKKADKVEIRRETSVSGGK